MIPMQKTEEKDKQSQKIGKKQAKMAQNCVFVPYETPLTDPDFKFPRGKTVKICTKIV